MKNSPKPAKIETANPTKLFCVIFFIMTLILSGCAYLFITDNHLKWLYTRISSISEDFLDRFFPDNLPIRVFYKLENGGTQCFHQAVNESIYGNEDFYHTHHLDDADIIWVRKYGRAKRIIFDDWLEYDQAINHIMNESLLTTKGHLTKILFNGEKEQQNRRYDPPFPERDDGLLDPRQFYPESYRLYNKTELLWFKRRYTKDPDIIWLLKPVGLSQGEGQRLVEFDDLPVMFEELEFYNGLLFVEEYGPEEYIIQRYISNLHLYHGYKFSMRQYWLITSTDPLKVLLFKNGTASVSSVPFHLDSLDPLIHLTNSYQQHKNEENYQEKVNIQMLADYFHQEGIVDSDWFEKKFKPRVKEIARTLSIKFASSLPNPRLDIKLMTFGLFGMDILFDTDGNLWVTEVQGGPGLSFHDPIKEILIPSLLQETLRIVNDVRKLRLKGKLAKTKYIPSVDLFEWVINDVKKRESSEL